MIIIITLDPEILMCYGTEVLSSSYLPKTASKQVGFLALVSAETKTARALPQVD